MAREPDERDALRRVIDFYLHTAYRGSRLLDRQHPPIEHRYPGRGLLPAALADDGAAMAWFDANHRCVMAMRAAAEEAGWDMDVWQLAWTLDNFHYRRGYIHDNIASWLAGLAAAERLRDVAAQARAHRRLGLVYAPVGGGQKTALHHLERSLTLSEEVGDLLGQAGAHFVLAMAWTHRDDYQRALTHVTSARNLYREAGDSTWEVRALSMMGACHTRLGHHDQASDYCESALDLCRRRGDVYGQADSLDNLGGIAAGTGRHTEALRHYEDALALWHDLDNTYRQAGTLTALGDSHRGLHQHEQARRAWQQAVDRYRDQNLETAAAPVEERLAHYASRVGDTHGGEPMSAADLLDRAHTMLSSGRLTDAGALFDRTVDAAREERNPTVFAEASLGLGGMWVNKYRGRADRVRVLARLDEALGGLPETATVLRRRLLTRRAAELAFEAGTNDEVLAALDAARRTGDRLALAEALSLGHHALLRPEHGEWRLAIADELITVASSAGFEMLTLVGLCRRTIDLFHLGDPRANGPWPTWAGVRTRRVAAVSCSSTPPWRSCCWSGRDASHWPRSGRPRAFSSARRSATRTRPCSTARTCSRSAGCRAEVGSWWTSPRAPPTRRPCRTPRPPSTPRWRCSPPTPASSTAPAQHSTGSPRTAWPPFPAQAPG